MPHEQLPIEGFGVWNLTRVLLPAVALSLVWSQAGIARLTPARPDYLLKLPARQWVYAERLSRDESVWTKQFCEAGYHDGDFVLSVDRQDDWVRIVAGFAGCDKPSWNIIELEAVRAGDRPALIRAKAEGMAEFAAKTCERPTPVVDLPSFDLLFVTAADR